MRRFLLALALLLAPLSLAAAQGTPAQRIQAARQRATQTGIPVTLLDSKVAEGRAKGIPEPRIAAAVERRLGSLQRARTAMRGGPRPPAFTAADLNVGADAIEAGADPGAVGRLAQAASSDRRAVAISALAELVRQGNSSERALQRVMAALSRGAEELRRLPGEDPGRGDDADRAPGQGPRTDRRGGEGSDDGERRGDQRGNTHGGRPDGRGRDNPSTHGGRGRGAGPPSSVPGRGRGRGHGGSHH